MQENNFHSNLIETLIWVIFNFTSKEQIPLTNE